MSSGHSFQSHTNPLAKAAHGLQSPTPAAAPAAVAPAEDNEAKDRDVELVQQLADWVVEKGILTDITGFLDENASVQLKKESGEFSIEGLLLYEQYTALVDNRLESFLKMAEVSSKDLKTACANVLNSGSYITVEDTKLRASNFLQAFFCSWDFESFASMIDSYKAAHK